MLFDDLNDDNFDLFAAKSYENPSCYDVKEYHADILRFRYIKRLLLRYKRSGDLSERLVINHLIIIYNVFGNNATRMLFLKLDENLHPILKTFLVFMSRMPKVILSVNGKNLISSEIPIDMKAANILREMVRQENG